VAPQHRVGNYIYLPLPSKYHVIHINQKLKQHPYRYSQNLALVISTCQTSHLILLKMKGINILIWYWPGV